MKKLLVFSAAALLCGMSLSAKTADELRIYLNPGHGSWTSNDRPMMTLREVDGALKVINPGTKAGSEVNSPDTTAFYESNTNLQKMLQVVDKLEEYGLKFDRTLNQDNPNPYRVGAALDLSQNIVMSRVKNGPFPNEPATTEICNRSLSEIRQEVEVNNFDMFFSLHSNAATDGSTAQYLAIFYRGYYSNATAELRGSGDSQDTPDLAPGSIDMCKAAAKYGLKMEHMHYTARLTDAIGSGCVIGDAEFQHNTAITNNNGKGYAGYYGVLKHGVPGYLAEGYFHTYQPARQRSMNFDACRVEGLAFVHGIADYWNLTKESTGAIFGVVRSKTERFSHQYYNPMGNTNDVYLPLNNCTVILKKDGQEVRRVVTDNHYNGAYVFLDVEPGTYTVEFEKGEYQMIEDADYTIVVKAAETTYPESWLNDPTWTPPTVVYHDYEDDMAEEKAYGVAAEYNMQQTYTDEAIAELDGLNVRRTIARNGKLYILAFNAENAATILVLDGKTRALLANVSTEGATGGNIRAIGDIALTADNRLVAVNAHDDMPFDNSGLVNFYQWENDENGIPTGNAISMGSTNHAGNWNNADFGKTMTYTGTLADGKMIFTNKSHANNNTRLEIVTVADGEVGGFWHENLNSLDGGKFSDATMGDFQIYVSPLHEDAVVFTAEKMMPFELRLTKASAGVPSLIAQMPEGVMEGTGFRAQFFKFGGSVLMAAPVTTADGKNAGVQLLNITKGLDKATLIATTNTALETPADIEAWTEVAAGVASANGELVVSRDGTGAYKSHAINLYITRENGMVSRFTTESVDQPAISGVDYAYDLNKTGEDELYTLSFKLTGDVLNARLVMTDTEDATNVKTVELGALKAGENTTTVDAADLDTGKTYNWAIEVEDTAIPQAGIVYNQNYTFTSATASRGGLVQILDPEQETFGTIIMGMGYAQGITMFSPALENLGTYHTGASTMDASNGSSLMRGGQRNGYAVFVDWSDGGAGYWKFDPKDQSLTNILAGTRDSGGSYKLNGVCVGGGATSFEVVGQGEDEQIYVFCEDYPNADGNNLIRYSTGGKELIDMAPDQVWDGNNGFPNIHGKYANTNVEINALPQALLISQNRNNANSKGCPCFEIYTYDGKLLLSSADDEYVAVYHSCSGGMAATPDGNTLAMPTWGNGIAIIDVDWTDAEKPVLSTRYVIPAPTKGTSAEYTQMVFDPAGNLLAFDRASGLKQFALRNDAPTTTTPARSELTLKGSSAVENVAVDATDTNAPVEYFDLQGRAINEPAAGSIVIRRQGTKATKVIIK